MTNKWRQGIRTHWPKLVLVFVVFVLMVWASYAYVAMIMRDQLRTTASQSLLTVEANIRTNLSGPDVVLVAATASLRECLEEESSSKIHTYMVHFTRWLLANKEHVSGFNGIYGWVDGEYLNGTGWIPSADYVAVERPWYLIGKAHKGLIGMTEPYVDAMTNERVITYAQELLDHHNVSHGVVGIDVLLKPVADYVTSVRLSEGGYSMLLSNDGTLLAHNDPNMIGKHLRDLSSDFASLAAELADEDGIFERRVTDATGSTSVVFVKRLYNGWYICMVASEKAYYSKVRTMAQVLFLMGLTFALILAIILLRLCLAQISADEANRTKTLFLARMSHDIRTPMNAIVGISELILHEPISRSVRAYTADVKQAGLNLLSLINDILDFSKIESGKMELNEAEYDLCLLIHDLVVIIKMRIAEAPVNFDVFIDSQLPAMLIGDEARIRQILLNLLSNAAKYTQKGEISLSIKGREISSGDDGGEIEIICEVQDSGIGIKPEDLGKLFGEFKRLDPQANAGVEGTGLGLAIARNLALMMNGDIAVSSEYGKGSVFVAKFRQRFKARACFAQVKNAAEKAVLVYEPRRAISAGWIIKTLENLGVYAEWVTTPETFERALGKRHYDFVFSWSFLAKGVMSALARHGMNTVPVLLDVRTGEPVPSGACALMLPAYSLSVANVLNGGTDGRYFAASKIGIHFTLPDVKALVVDDIEVNLRVAKGLMSYYEMQIDCALSGAEAILLARRNRYDIIFMDHMMPQMDGIEAVARLRALGGEFENLPIVALTANAISGMREMFLSCGFTDFLSKPIEMSKLSDILERWIPKTRRLERLSEKEEQQARVEISSASSAPIAPISGVDMALGLSRIGGKVEDYVEMLAAFVRDTEERLEKFDLSDIKTFVIHVHAFKAAAANVGASDVSAAAAALEAAGMANDKAAIAEHWDDFAASLKALNANIRAALQETQEATVGLAAQSTLEEREILIHLKTAIRDLDIDGMDTALERLQRVPLDLHWREQVAAIANMVLLARFDEALEVIEVLETASSLQRRGVKT